MEKPSYIKLKDPSVLRIFFSSPFKGMEGEREEFTRRYFPVIESLCKSRGIHFVPVDMRWGITTEQSESNQTVNICLRELQRSDMFVGFYGQRYGWHGEGDESLMQSFDEAMAQFPWIDKYRDRSVTELEFLAGHLNSPGNMPACIAFRSKVYDDAKYKEALKAGDKKVASAYKVESDAADVKMRDLKERVTSTKDNTLGVFLDYKQPAEGVSCLYHAMIKYLQSTLEYGTKMTKYETELNQHTSFLNMKTKLYIGGEENIEKINNFSKSDTSTPLVVIGEPGHGKTALLCNWIKLKSIEGKTVIYHFVGVGSESTTVENILQRIIRGLQHCGTGRYDDDLPEQIPSLLSLLKASFNQLESVQKNAIIVIDGMNKVLKKTQTELPLFWLPETYPAHVKVILAVRSSNLEIMQELQRRQYEMFHIDPLDVSVRRKIVVKMLQNVGKTLSESQLERIVAAPNTVSPLFLQVVVEELCMFGYFRQLDQKIDALITSKNVQELFTHYIERLESDYNPQEYSGNLIQKVLCSICLCQNGASEKIITGMYEIPDQIWLPLYFAVEKFLIKRSGNMSFAQMELKEAVESKYFQTSSDREMHAKEMAEYYAHIIHTDTLRYHRPDRHVMFEAPWLCQIAGLPELLKTVLSNFHVNEYLFEYSKYKLLSYWNWLKMNGKEIAECMLQNIDMIISEFYVENQRNYIKLTPPFWILNPLADLNELLILGDYSDGSELISNRMLRLLEVDGEPSEGWLGQFANKQHAKAAALYSLALCRSAEGRYQDSQNIHMQVIELLKGKEDMSAEEEHLLAFCYHGLGTTYQQRKDYDKAEEYYIKAMQQEDKANVPDKMKYKANTLMNIALVLSETGQKEESLKKYEDVIKIHEEMYFGELPPETSYVLNNIGNCYRSLGRMEEAEQALKKSLKIKIKALGYHHNDVAIAYAAYSNFEKARGNAEKVEEYLLKALQIYKETGSEDKRDCILSKENLALFYITEFQDLEKAEPYFWDVFDAYVKTSFSGALPLVHQNFVEYYMRTKQYDKNHKLLPHLVRSNMATARNFGQLHYLDYYECAQRPTRSYEESIYRGIGLFPEDQTLLECLIQDVLVPQGDVSAITEAITNYFQHAEATTTLFLVTADWLEQATNLDGAIKILNLGLQYLPEHEELLRNLATTHNMKGDTVLTKDYLYRAFRVNPNVLPVTLNLAKIALNLLDFQCYKETVAILKENWAENEKVMASVSEMDSQCEELEQWNKSQTEQKNNEMEPEG